jgi:heptaprenyl diphosphate synthase
MAQELEAPTAKAEAAFWDWVDGYVTQPHPELGRDGSVCPFVRRLADSGNIHVQVDDSLDGTDAGAVEARMRVALRDYEAMPDRQWKALVVVFPTMAGADVAVVDRVQAALKLECVRKGLMVGQFHPLSTEPGARNPHFPANRAPFAAIALRHMSHHDIVFLDRNAEMFREFDARFGPELSGGSDRDPFLVERYAAAAERFGAG